MGSMSAIDVAFVMKKKFEFKNGQKCASIQKGDHLVPIEAFFSVCSMAFVHDVNEV